MVDKAAAQDDDDDGDDVDDANDDNWKVGPDQFNKSVRALAEALSSILPCHPLPLHYTMYTTLPTPPMPLYCAVHITYFMYTTQCTLNNNVHTLQDTEVQNLPKKAADSNGSTLLSNWQHNQPQ